MKRLSTKYICLVLALAVFLLGLNGAALPTSVSAVANGITISVGTATGKAGSTVSVPIKLSNVAANGSIAACDFKVSYDTNLLSVASVTAGSIILNSASNFSYSVNTNEKSINFLFLDNTLVSQLISTDGVFATINFLIKSTATTAVTTPITVSSVGAFANSDLTYMAVNQSIAGSIGILSSSSTVAPTTAIFYKEVARQANIATTMNLNGNTLTAIKNGTYTLVAGTDYTVSGSVVTINKTYLAKLANGIYSLTYVFSKGSNATVVINVITSGTVAPTTAIFYKEIARQANVVTTITPNGNTLSVIKNGSYTLVKGTDYTVVGNVVTITKAYLAKLVNGSYILNYVFNKGAIATVTISVVTSATVTPTTAIFYKEVARQANLVTTITPNGNTLSVVKNGAYTLVKGTDYTVVGNVVTINKTYLAKLVNGSYTLTYVFNKGVSPTVALSVVTSGTVAPTTATFYKEVARQANVVTTIIPNGNTLSAVKNGTYTLVKGTDYTVVGNVVTINKTYLAKLVNGSYKLTYVFNKGVSPTVALNVVTSSTVTPPTATFYKETARQANIITTITSNGNTLAAIKNGTYTLVKGTDYSVVGNVVTIYKTYLAKLANGTATLTYVFNKGANATVSVKIATSPTVALLIANSTVTPATAVFYKEAARQANIITTMTLNGNTLTAIKNGTTTLVKGTDYTVVGNVVTINKTYLAKLVNGSYKLTYVFNKGVSPTVALTVVTSGVVTPTTAVFYKETVRQANIITTMTLNGNTLTAIKNGTATLVKGTDYTVVGNVVTINKTYLAKLVNGSYKLTYVFNKGVSPTVALTVVTSGAVTPTTAVFYKEAARQANIVTTITPNGNTFTAVKNGAYTLVKGTDYTVVGNVITINKTYLAKLVNGTYTLTYVFNKGVSPTVVLTVITSGAVTPATAIFDKLPPKQANIATTITFNGNTLTAIKNGTYTLVLGKDYTVASNVVTINKAYLDKLNNGSYTLTYVFNKGASATITLSVVTSATVTPPIITFYTETGRQYDIVTTMNLNGNTLTTIKNGTYTLVKGTDYTVSGNVVTISKKYLAQFLHGKVTLTYVFSKGANATVTINIVTSAYVDDPSALFYKDTAHQADISVEMVLNESVLTAIKNETSTLVKGIDYTVSGTKVTISKNYLAKLSGNSVKLTFVFDKGATDVLPVYLLNHA